MPRTGGIILPLVVQQTRLERNHKEALQAYAGENGMSYQDLWTDAVIEFLQARAGLLKQGVRVSYLATPSHAIIWSTKLSREVVDEVNLVAQTDYSSARRLYYTALVHFVENHIDKR